MSAAELKHRLFLLRESIYAWRRPERYESSEPVLSQVDAVEILLDAVEELLSRVERLERGESN